MPHLEAAGRSFLPSARPLVPLFGLPFGLAFGLALGACSATVSPTGSPPAAGFDAGSFVAADGAPGLGPAEGGSLVSERSGFVEIESTTYPFGGVGVVKGSVAQAEFVVVRGDAGAARCKTTSLDSCDVEACSGNAVPFADFVSAGPIHLTGLTSGAPTSWVPMGASYLSMTAQETWWSGGETVSVRAEGDIAPAFEASLTAPTAVTVTGAPRFWDNAGTPEVVATNGLAVAWSGGKPGDLVRVKLIEAKNPSGTESITVRCDFEASKGQATVSGAVLAMLGKATVGVQVYVAAQKRSEVSTWKIRTTLLSLALSDKGPGQGNITLK